MNKGWEFAVDGVIIEIITCASYMHTGIRLCNHKHLFMLNIARKCSTENPFRFKTQFTNVEVSR